MANAKVIAIVVVITIVAAAVVTAAILTRDDDNSYKSADTTGRLQIYGNANNDDYMDNDDVEFIKEIIEKNSDDDPNNNVDWRAKYPMADANHSGEVDNDDVAWAEKMVNRDKMTIWYVNGMGEDAEVKYPMNRVVVVGSNAMLTVHALGAVPAGKVVGVTGEPNKDTFFFSDVDGITKVSGDSVLKAEFDIVSKIDGGVDGIITQNSKAYLKNEATFTNAGYDVVRIASSDGLSAASVALTIGYILGLEEQANKYAKFCDDIVSAVKDKAVTITSSNKVDVLIGTMTNYVSGLDSDYYELSLLCGGNNLADWKGATKQYMDGDEWLKEKKYYADWFIHFRNYSYNPNFDVTSVYKEYERYYDDIQTYKDGHYVIMNGYMPALLRMAYIATQLYPNVYGTDWADELHQEYIDNFVSNLAEQNYEVVHSQFVVTYKDAHGSDKPA